MYGQFFLYEEEIFQVLANEKRLEILQLLRTGERNVSEMLSMLGMRQANLSQHLALLKRSGLVLTTKRGREMYYKISSDYIVDAMDSIHEFTASRHTIENPEKSIFPFVIDPICGMRLSVADAYDSIVDSDGEHFFCASGCMNTYSHKQAT